MGSGWLLQAEVGDIDHTRDRGVAGDNAGQDKTRITPFASLHPLLYDNNSKHLEWKRKLC